MLQADEPDDFVIATGRQCSVRNFVELVSEKLGYKIYWSGSDLKEVGKWKIGNKFSEVVIVDKSLFRPSEVQSLLGDSQKARKILNWIPKTTLEQLVTEMVDYELLVKSTPKAKIDVF
jgi:GDPmannose 4,6-dehydratase